MESRKDLEALAEQFFYPPKGKRGLGPTRQNKWGSEIELDIAPRICVQIETVLGIQNIESIASLDFVETLFVGPYDLSASLGDPGNFQGEKYSKAVDRVRVVSKDHNKRLGFHVANPKPEDLKQAIDSGFSFITYSYDIMALRYALRGMNEK